MSARFGLPYQGSKNKIARWVIEQMPSATHFYDLCCGGCAVTHAAMLSGKYKYFHINDINPMWPQMFVDAINGKYRDERRIITRQDFKMWKDSDPYVALCWSFGNNARTYIWGEDVEGVKLAACRMLVADTLSERRLLYKQFIKALKAYAGEGRLSDLQGLEWLEALERLEALGRLEALERLQGEVTATSVSYTDVEIEPDAVVYCDIPYRDTQGYVGGGVILTTMLFTSGRQQRRGRCIYPSMPCLMILSVSRGEVTFALRRPTITQNE